jgi:hypothetical protein
MGRDLIYLSFPNCERQLSQAHPDQEKRAIRTFTGELKGATAVKKVNFGSYLYRA